MYPNKLFGTNTVKDQWDCVLNDLEELGDKEFLVLTSQYIIEIFSCGLRLLPLYSSTFHQTNVESSQIYTEDNLSVSRIRSHHLLLEDILHVEEECLVFLPLGTLDRIELPVQYQSIFFHEYEQVVEGLLGFALASGRLAKANSSVFVSEVSCSLSSYSLSIKSVTNLFNP